MKRVPHRLLVIVGFLFWALTTHRLTPRSAELARTGWQIIPRIIVIGAESDPRLPLVRDAVDHWNEIFAAMGTSFRLGPVSRVDEPVPSDDLARLSNEVLSRRFRGPLPDFARYAPPGIVVVLATTDFISFDISRFRFGHALVAIKDGHAYPLSLPNVARNVIAHEIGHAIGLGHNADPKALMCGRPAPCRPSLFASSSDRYFPLTDSDRTSLRKMYPRDWKPLH